MISDTIKYEPSFFSTFQLKDRYSDPYSNLFSNTAYDINSSILKISSYYDTAKVFFVSEKMGSLYYRPPIGIPFNKFDKYNTDNQIKNYFKEKIDAGETLSVDELANRLPSNDETKNNFAAFTDSLENPLEKEIQPDPAALKQLAKFTGQGGGVSVSFERKLMGDRVFYDPATDTLTIRGIPPNLKDQLNRQSSMD